MDSENIGCIKKSFAALLTVVLLMCLISSKFVHNGTVLRAFDFPSATKFAPTSHDPTENVRLGEHDCDSVSDGNVSGIHPLTQPLRVDKKTVRFKFNYPMPVDLSDEDKNKLDFAIKKAQTEKKVILDWYAQHPRSVIMKGICGYCEITSNRSKIDDPLTKAVVFMYREIQPFSMPSPLLKRRTDQIHVWQTGEAPPSLLYLHRRYFRYEEKYRFNMTQSFRRDSGIYHPYGSSVAVHAKKIKQGYHKNLTKVLDGKSRVAVAVISNCHSLPGANIRLQFVRDLKEDGLNVHTLGRCFHYNTYQKKDIENFSNLLKTYKFYLAFENSYHCRDYVTEKFFQNGLEAGSIPVVWGAAKEDYEEIAPRGSFIYADDFNTTKELVNYIHYLDKNDTAYLEYFKWYQMPKEKLPDYGRQIRYCQLCRIIHGINVDDVYHPDYNSSNPERPLVSDEIYPRTVKSLHHWYYKTENRDCMKSTSRFYHDNLSLPARTLDGRT